VPEADEVVVYRSFMKVGHRFPLDKCLVEVLKTFEIYLHQITPEAIIIMDIFIWALRIQGLEPNAKCFCNMHELSYEMKATSKEQYHNNFSCYGFVPRSAVSYPVPTFQKRWPGAWIQEWFYVKNDLVEREVSVFRDRGVPRPTSKCRHVPQPRWVDARPSVKGGSEVAGDRRERGGNPAAFVFVPRPGRVRLQ
jgi:hypothetical protein